MQLDELKKNMSTLEQVLAKTNPEIRINVAASETAKSKILKKFRQGFTGCLVLAVSFAAMAIANVSPQSFPDYLKIGMSICLALGAVWYAFMYRKLKRIDIAALPPAQLFSRTATLKLMVLSGELFFLICLAVFFTLLFQVAWTHNRIGFWAMTATLVYAIVAGILHYWPQYIRLFRELDYIKD